MFLPYADIDPGWRILSTKPISSVPQKDGFGLKLGSYPRFQPGILFSREVRGID